jgi:hypothetical protein
LKVITEIVPVSNWEYFTSKMNISSEIFIREVTKDASSRKIFFREYQNSGNHLKENPEVLSRLGHQAGSEETKVSAAKLHNVKEATPIH